VDPQENALLAPVGPAQEAVRSFVSIDAPRRENRLNSLADRHLDAEPLRQFDTAVAVATPSTTERRPASASPGTWPRPKCESQRIIARLGAAAGKHQVAEAG